MIALIRHGETDWNRTGRLQGRLDVPLNEVGKRQALECGEALAALSWRAVVTSPLSRARETARIIAGCVGCPPPAEDAGMLERDYGEGNGLTAEERERRFPGGCPGLESREDAGRRLTDCLRRHAECFAGEGADWIAVSHGSAIRAAIPFLLGRAVLGTEERIQNGGVTLLRYEDSSFFLTAYNVSPGEARAILAVQARQ